MNSFTISAEHLSVLSKCPLFSGIPEDKAAEMLSYLHSFIKTYQKGENLIKTGAPFLYAGLVLKGKIEISYINSNFDKVTVNHLGASQIFGEALALKKAAFSPIQIDALTDCRILYLDLNHLLLTDAGCNDACSFKHQLLLNLTNRMAEQNLFGNLKLRILSQKSLRDRILVYLYSLPADEKGVRRLPFTQTALAEFLNVNRSALSRELGRMQDEGILRLDKRSCILQTDAIAKRFVIV